MEQNIYTAINEVMKQVGYVQKQKANNLNYTYAGERALIAAIRPAMVENGIVVYPSGANFQTETYETAKGTVMNRVIGVYRFTFYHGESNTGFEVEVTGEGSDAGDKAANKALTGAYKYALRQTFCIETGDDPDQFNSDEMVRAPKSAAQPAAPADDTVFSWNGLTVPKHKPMKDLNADERDNLSKMMEARNYATKFQSSGRVKKLAEDKQRGELTVFEAIPYLKVESKEWDKVDTEMRGQVSLFIGDRLPKDPLNPYNKD